MLSIFLQNQAIYLPGEVSSLAAAQKVVDLSKCSLVGPIPASLQTLVSPTVEVLNLSHNSLNDSIPDFVGSFKSLKVLKLESNNFSGVLPDSIWELNQLLELSFAHNQFEGNIPASITKLKELKVLCANHCCLNGELSVETIRFISMMQVDSKRHVDLAANEPGFTLPSSMGDLNDLNELSLRDCSIRGSIPQSLGLLEGLQYLNLSENRLNGELPLNVISLISLNKSRWPFALRGNIGSNFPRVGGFTLPPNIGELRTTNSSNLKILDLSHCSLVGSIPSSISALSGLEGINLSFNELSGCIPSTICFLRSLKTIDLQNNSLEGPIPHAIGSIKSLTKVNLSSNRLTGVLPTSLGDVGQLEELYLGGNRISGEIPDVLGNLSDLRIISLEGNLISGVIPSSIGLLEHLEILILAKNRFVGLIPSSFKGLTNARTIDLAGNLLSGAIPDSFDVGELTILDLSMNNFSDEVPESIFELERKQTSAKIDLTYNYLEGSVPGIQGKQNSANPLYDEDLIWIGRRGLESPRKAKGAMQEESCANFCEIFSA